MCVEETKVFVIVPEIPAPVLMPAPVKTLEHHTQHHTITTTTQNI
jgi:hypothetical protein